TIWSLPRALSCFRIAWRARRCGSLPEGHRSLQAVGDREDLGFGQRAAPDVDEAILLPDHGAPEAGGVTDEETGHAVDSHVLRGGLTDGDRDRQRRRRVAHGPLSVPRAPGARWGER